jgi:GT2 family glycosyltransferase
VAQFVPRFEHANDQEFASFACAAINPETWIALGGFDARFFLFYEDADLCQRLHEKGQRILFDRKISVVHVPTTSGGGRRLAPHLARLARKSQALFFAKHRPPWQAAVIRFIGRVFGGKET